MLVYLISSARDKFSIIFKAAGFRGVVRLSDLKKKIRGFIEYLKPVHVTNNRTIFGLVLLRNEGWIYIHQLTSWSDLRIKRILI